MSLGVTYAHEGFIHGCVASTRCFTLQVYSPPYKSANAYDADGASAAAGSAAPWSLGISLSCAAKRATAGDAADPLPPPPTPLLRLSAFALRLAGVSCCILRRDSCPAVRPSFRRSCAQQRRRRGCDVPTAAAE